MSVVSQSSGPVAQSYSVVVHYDYTDPDTGAKVKGKVEGLIRSTVYSASPDTKTPAPPDAKATASPDTKASASPDTKAPAQVTKPTFSIVFSIGPGAEIKSRDTLQNPTELLQSRHFPEGDAGMTSYLKLANLDFKNLYRGVESLGGDLGDTDGSSYVHWKTGIIGKIAINSRETWPTPVTYIELYADIDGWIAAYLPVGTVSSSFAHWEGACGGWLGSPGLASTNLLTSAIQTFLAALGMEAETQFLPIKHYHFAFPAATEVLVFGAYGAGNFSLIVPEGLTIEEASVSLVECGGAEYALSLSGEKIFDFRGQNLSSSLLLVTGTNYKFALTDPSGSPMQPPRPGALVPRHGSGSVAVVVITGEQVKPPVVPTSTLTPSPQDLFQPLRERFHIWNSRWIEKYGEPPYTFEQGRLNGSKTIYLPMCGVVTAQGGYGFSGFRASDSVPLGRHTIALSGDHHLIGNAVYIMDYVVTIRPPDLIGEGSVTTQYNDEIKNFLDFCGG
jgi:hypothetical protein